MASKQCCFVDACGGCKCADACQILMLHELGAAFLSVNVRYISHYQRTCILSPIWFRFIVDSTRSTQQDRTVSCNIFCAQVHQGLRCTSCCAPTTICVVHLLLSQTHTQKCPIKNEVQLLKTLLLIPL